LKSAYKPPNGLLKGPRKTTDGRFCTKECTANAIPGSKNAPSPPSENELG